MQSLRTSLIILATMVLLQANAVATTVPATLAFVGDDTLTTVDLTIELNIMEKRSGGQKQSAFPEPEAVLKRLIQNRLIIQEGYRMGLEEEFTIKNQVIEAVNATCMGALLDSVALAAPMDSENLKETRRQAVKEFINDLMVTYDVQVDSTMLQSLDYGSADPEMQKRLRDSNEIIATVPTGNLKVSALSRIIRFTAFHGLEGKPDAAARRDKIFHEWLTEAVVLYEARQQSIENKPVIQLYKSRLERSLMLEEALKILLQFPFEPTEEDIASFHQEHSDLFLKPAQVRMESLKFSTEEAAMAGRNHLENGVKMKWIKQNMDQVIDGPAPFPGDWFEASKLDLKDDMVRTGYIPDPYGVPGGWVLAQVSDVNNGAVIPLSVCKDKVMRMMKAEATNEQIKEITRRLEEVVEIRIESGAIDTIKGILEELENQQ
jgi:hypothetical protein